MPLGKLYWLLQPTLNTTIGTVTAHTHTQAHIIKLASLKWQDGGTTSSKWTDLCKFSFTWSCLLCNSYQFCSSNVWVIQHHSVHALDVMAIIDFCVFGVKNKWNKLSSYSSRHCSCIHKGLHAGKWPDLMTFKPDAFSTLGYQWTDYTGTTLADASTQWCPSANPVLICIIGTHWKTSGRPLEDHWKHTGNTLVTNSSFFQWHSNVHWGLSSRHTGLPLDCHRITTGSG